MDYREPGPEFLVGPDFIGFGNIHAVTYKRNTNLVIPTGAYPDFLLRCPKQIHVCAFP
jgi:hypothetical protein